MTDKHFSYKVIVQPKKRGAIERRQGKKRARCKKTASQRGNSEEEYQGRNHKVTPDVNISNFLVECKFYNVCLVETSVIYQRRHAEVCRLTNGH
jgi:hypothetical protein